MIKFVLKYIYQIIFEVYQLFFFYRVCVDMIGRGEFCECKLLVSYYEEYQYGIFSRVDMMNYGVNIYNDGNILEIVINVGEYYMFLESFL